MSLRPMFSSFKLKKQPEGSDHRVDQNRQFKFFQAKRTAQRPESEGLPIHAMPFLRNITHHEKVKKKSKSRSKAGSKSTNKYYRGFGGRIEEENTLKETSEASDGISRELEDLDELGAGDGVERSEVELDTLQMANERFNQLQELAFAQITKKKKKRKNKKKTAKNKANEQSDDSLEVKESPGKAGDEPGSAKSFFLHKKLKKKKNRKPAKNASLTSISSSKKSIPRQINNPYNPNPLNPSKKSLNPKNSKPKKRAKKLHKRISQTIIHEEESNEAPSISESNHKVIRKPSLGVITSRRLKSRQPRRRQLITVTDITPSLVDGSHVSLDPSTMLKHTSMSRRKKKTSRNLNLIKRKLKFFNQTKSFLKKVNQTNQKLERTMERVERQNREISQIVFRKVKETGFSKFIRDKINPKARMLEVPEDWGGYLKAEGRVNGVRSLAGADGFLLGMAFKTVE